MIYGQSKGALNNASANRIDSCQPARTAQADMGRNCLLLVNFPYAQRISVPYTYTSYYTN